MTSTLDLDGLAVDYDATVLEPRPWTAAQSRLAADLSTALPDGPLLELCCGAGHIGLLAARLTGRDAVLVDASEDACRFAERNAEQVRAEGVEVVVRHGRMTDVLDDDETFALVVADPPYIPSSDVGTFPGDPTLAIDGGDDGLAVARSCLEVAAHHLADDGVMVLQLRTTAQAERLAAVAARRGLRLDDAHDVGGRGALVVVRRERHR